MNADGWPTVAVMGAGAVGCFFGGLLARAGAPVTFIGRRHHVDAIARDGLFLEGLHFQERVAAAATTDAGAARDADIVLFCVKTLDTENAAKTLQPHLAPQATVVSMQNGVDNAERIYSAAGIEAVPAVVYVACAMMAPGHVKHNGRGDLIVGKGPRAAAVASMFERAGVPCPVSDRVKAELWMKLIMNCAYNAMSALCRARYGNIVRAPWTRELMRRTVLEVVSVARTAGVPLEEEPAVEAAYTLGEAMASALSSTAQDIDRGKPTEIDSLNGYVVRRGKDLGVDTPVNQALHGLVKLLEASGAGRVA